VIQKSSTVVSFFTVVSFDICSTVFLKVECATNFVVPRNNGWKHDSDRPHETLPRPYIRLYIIHWVWLCSPLADSSYVLYFLVGRGVSLINNLGQSGPGSYNIWYHLFIMLLHDSCTVGFTPVLLVLLPP